MILEGDNRFTKQKIMGATNPKEADKDTIRNFWNIVIKTYNGSDSKSSMQKNI